MWHSLTQITHIPMATLWENTAIYVYWLYEKRMQEFTDDEHRQLIEDDFHYLLFELDGKLFGCKDNPLYTYYSKIYQNPLTGSSIRVRKTCCLYYKTKPGNPFCSGCPIIYT